MITNFQIPNLQREIIRKKIKYFFFNFHQLIYSSSFISWPSLKLQYFLRCPTYKIALLALKRGITRHGEIIQTREKIWVSYFLTRNPYMKFQNASLKFFWTDGPGVTLCGTKQLCFHFIDSTIPNICTHHILFISDLVGNPVDMFSDQLVLLDAIHPQYSKQLRPYQEGLSS